MNQDYRDICQSCGGHIAYDEQYAGRRVQCPHCGEETTLGEARLGDPDLIVNAKEGGPSTIRSSRNIAALAILLLFVLTVGVGALIATNKRAARQRRATEELARAKVYAERAQAEAETAKAEAEVAKLRVEQEEKAKAALTAAAQAEAAATAEAAKQKAEAQARLEEEAKRRVKKNPSVWALWQEQNHEAISVLATRVNDAIVKYRGVSLNVEYEDMPEWLRLAAETKHKKDGEAKGLIREVNGQIYDLRASPPGWLALQAADVVQILEDGYLMIDVASLGKPYAQPKVFKLKHNGLTRIMNTGERIQVTAMSAGTYTYENKRYDIKTVPVYDPGMPVGPLRAKVVSMNGTPAKIAERAKPASDEPIGNGSGFFITEDGLFLSNAHVVGDSTKLEVRIVAGKKPAAVVCVDKDKDLALLRVSVVPGSVPSLSVSTNIVSLGTQVFTIGYPLVELQGSRPKFTDGRVSSVAGIRDDPDQMQISVPVQPGNSGGALADLNGDIVGVVVARLNDLKVIALAGSIPQNVNYAVKGATLIRFLSEHKDVARGIKFGSSPKRSQEEAIQAVEKSSGLVLVY